MGWSDAYFSDGTTEALLLGVDSRRGRRACPQALWPGVRRKLDQLNRVKDLPELGVPPGNRLERFRGDREGQHSLRINEQYRICFRWEESDAYEVEVTDYH
jgi:toxin HigB-1